jgi:hypothetical protein
MLPQMMPPDIASCHLLRDAAYAAACRQRYCWLSLPPCQKTCAVYFARRRIFCLAMLPCQAIGEQR